MIKTIFISGASSGIGAALAENAASPAVTLHLLARREDRLHAVADICRTKGATVHTYVMDVCDALSLRNLLEKIDDTTPLDLVIANAGISGGTGGMTETMKNARSYDQDQHIFDVNVDGVLHTIHPIIPRMIARSHGQIAIISSLAGYLALPGAPAYTASKAAVRFYGQALALKLRPHNVFISVICPGFVESEMTAVNDFAMPFLMPVNQAAQHIWKEIARQKPLIAFPRRAVLATRLLQILPVSLQNCIFNALPEKKGLSKP